jgi:hypothetical protein
MSERGVRSSLRDGWPAPANVDRSPLTFVAGPSLPQGHQRVDGHERDEERYCNGSCDAERGQASFVPGQPTAFIPALETSAVTVQRAYSGSRGDLGALTGAGCRRARTLFSEARRTLVALLFLCRNPRITPAQGSSQGAHCAISI